MILPAGQPPDPSGVGSLDDLAMALNDLRRWAGNPSYSKLADQIGVLRAQDGRPGRPGKVTVYDCFRSGRKRLDGQLFADLISVLGLTERPLGLWMQAYRSATGGLPEAAVLGSATTNELQRPRARLVGRESELASLEGRPPGSASLIVGLPGVGKTELALHLANRWRRRLGPEAIALGLNLRGYDPELEPLSASTVLGRLLIGLGVPGNRIESLAPFARAELLREVVRRRPLVVLLDNAGAAAQVLPLLPVGDRWRLVVTSRRRLPELELTTGAPLVLGPLSESAAVELLADGVGAARVAAEPIAAAQIASRCGFLALDLTLVGAAIANEPDGWTLSDHAARFEALPADELVRPALRLSYTAVAEPVRRTLRLAGLHPGPQFSRTQLAALAGLGEPAVAGHLNQLVTEHLVMQVAGGYVLHDLVRAFALRQLVLEDPRSQQVLAMRRLSEVLVSQARDHAFPGQPDSVWLEIQLPVAQAFAATAADWGLGAELGELVIPFTEFLDVAGRLGEAEQLVGLALAQPGAPNSALLRRKLGRILELRGDLAGALEQLLAGLDPEDPEYGRTCNGVGNVLKRLGRIRESVRYYGLAARRAAAANDAMARGRALGNLADAVRVLGHGQLAEGLFDAAEAFSSESADQVNLAIVASNRCLMVEQEGNLELAVKMARKHVPMTETLGFVALTVSLQAVIARSLLADGDLGGSAEALALAMGLAEQAKMPEPLCALQVIRGRLLAADGQLDQAEDEITEAMVAAAALGAALTTADAYWSLGELAVVRGDELAALAAFRRAAEVSRDTGDAAVAGRVAAAIARLAPAIE